MDWAFIFLMLGLKIPLAALIYLVWWAIRQSPDPDDETAGGGDGGSKVVHPRPPFPRRPRSRGPHGDPLPRPPARTRTSTLVARHRVHERT